MGIVSHRRLAGSRHFPQTEPFAERVMIRPGGVPYRS
jgi:hypothetical protein